MNSDRPRNIEIISKLLELKTVDVKDEPGTAKPMNMIDDLIDDLEGVKIVDREDDRWSAGRP